MRERLYIDPEHEYPEGAYRPGPDQYWALNEAWRVLDLLRPGVLNRETRLFLAGAITGALDKAVEEHGRKD